MQEVTNNMKITDTNVSFQIKEKRSWESELAKGGWLGSIWVWWGCVGCGRVGWEAELGRVRVVWWDGWDRVWLCLVVWGGVCNI